MSPEQRLGQQAEGWVMAQLRERGLSTYSSPSFTTVCCDLMVEDLPIEVKIANVTYRHYRNRDYRRWQWRIHETQKYHRREWVLILIAEYLGQYYPFIMPGSMVNLRPHLQITSTPLAYSGWMAAWLNRWDVIEYLLSGVYRNGGPLLGAEYPPHGGRHHV